MLLSLPKNLGGYWISKPALNYSIPMTDEEKFFHKRNAIIVDCAWPKDGLALEYDSDFFHYGDEKRIEDSIRRNIIFALGFDVTTITRKEFNDIARMDSIASVLELKLGKRRKNLSLEYIQRRICLREQLKASREK